MSDNKSAFPVAAAYSWDEGMTLRDYFAAKALEGLLASGDVRTVPERDVADYAYRYAEAMMAERAKSS